MRMPSIYLPHGGGPWPFVPVGPQGTWRGLEQYLSGLMSRLSEQPRAILCVSAHWEEPVPTVQTHPSPPLLFDYYGFPEAAYQVKWPAPGHPALAEETLTLLAQAGLAGRGDGSRGFDHGTFVPLKVALPEANLPTFQLSLIRGLSPKAHIELGRALSPLRDRGVLIVGSGMSYHNMRGFGSTAARETSAAFDTWLAYALAQAPHDRESLLVDWVNAPAARACHPREEHLLPLHVVLGSAYDEKATLPFRDQVLGAKVSAVHFG